MRSAEKNPLTPRETAIRMLQHMHDDVSYGDVIRQLRILEDIENTLNDVDVGGSPAADAVDDVRSQFDASVEDAGAAAQDQADSPAGGRTDGSRSSALVLRSHASGNERRDGRGGSNRTGAAHDSLLRRAVWHP